MEAGLQHRTLTGRYDSSGKRDKFPSSQKREQVDFPLGVRLGLPSGLEAHLMLPFKSADGKAEGAVFRSNMEAGLKYTYRPYNVGVDISYGLGFEEGSDALSHDYLAISLLGMASKDKILASAQAGFEFHFPDKKNTELDPGDIAAVKARLGYLVDPWLPYLGLSGAIMLDSDNDGTPVEDGGYMVVPEPGVVFDYEDKASFQLGIPFTILGRSIGSYWGVHGSLALRISMF
jgi:hypothetical protein